MAPGVMTTRFGAGQSWCVERPGRTTNGKMPTPRLSISPEFIGVRSVDHQGAIMVFARRLTQIADINASGTISMIQQFSDWRTLKRVAPVDTVVPVVLSVWIGSYLAVDLIMWAGGRSTLASNIFISLPLMVTASVLTLALEQLRRRLLHLDLALIVAILIPAVLAAAIVQGLVDYICVQFAAAALFPEWQAYVPVEGRQFGFGIYVYILHFLFCLLALTQLQTRRSMEIAVRRHAAALSAHHRAEARALRLQLNPHFLFNALNSIAALVTQQGNRVADAMICRLSDFLRASIVANADDDVSLPHEIATTESYLAIEQLRFRERLSVHLAIAPHAWDATIPAFLLQPLAENAVKHGLAEPQAAIRLTIDARREQDCLVITVTDRRISDTPRRAARRPDSPGIGLTNVRERLALLGTDRARLETEQLPDGFCAKLTLPFRQYLRTRHDA